MTAEIRVLSEGYLSGDDDRVGSTVSLVTDGDVVAVIDPGLVASRAAILGPLRVMGFEPEDVTDVVISHHHPDHTLNAALFPNARVHDHWAWYRDDLWVDRPAEGFELSSSIRLIETSCGECPGVLHENRARVLSLRGLRTIVPGHGAPFEPGPDTPR